MHFEAYKQTSNLGGKGGLPQHEISHIERQAEDGQGVKEYIQRGQVLQFFKFLGGYYVRIQAEIGAGASRSQSESGGSLVSSSSFFSFLYCNHDKVLQFDFNFFYNYARLNSLIQDCLNLLYGVVFQTPYSITSSFSYVVVLILFLMLLEDCAPSR